MLLMFLICAWFVEGIWFPTLTIDTYFGPIELAVFFVSTCWPLFLPWSRPRLLLAALLCYTFCWLCVWFRNVETTPLGVLAYPPICAVPRLLWSSRPWFFSREFAFWICWEFLVLEVFAVWWWCCYVVGMEKPEGFACLTELVPEWDPSVRMALRAERSWMEEAEASELVVPEKLLVFSLSMTALLT